MQPSQAMADGGTRKNWENETGVIDPPYRINYDVRGNNRIILNNGNIEKNNEKK